MKPREDIGIVNIRTPEGITIRSDNYKSIIYYRFDVENTSTIKHIESIMKILIFIDTIYPTREPDIIGTFTTYFKDKISKFEYEKDRRNFVMTNLIVLKNHRHVAIDISFTFTFNSEEDLNSFKNRFLANIQKYIDMIKSDDYKNYDFYIDYILSE